MSDDHGRFIWCELTTPDVPRAKAPYGDVVGWTAQDMPTAGMVYSLWQGDGVGHKGA